MTGFRPEPDLEPNSGTALIIGVSVSSMDLASVFSLAINFNNNLFLLQL